MTKKLVTNSQSLIRAVNELIYLKTKDGRLDTIKGTIPSQVKVAARMVNQAYENGLIDLKIRHKLMDCVYTNGSTKRECCKRMVNSTIGCSANSTYINSLSQSNCANLLSEINLDRKKELEINKLNNTSNEVWLKKGKVCKKRTSNNVSKLVKNKNDYIVLYLAIKSVASALIYGDTSIFIKYFNSLNYFPKQIRQYIAIRQSKKMCGISTYILDKEARGDIFKLFKGLDLRVSSNNKDDYCKVIDVLSIKYSINDDVIRCFENEINSNKFNNKESLCNYTFLKCICPEVEPIPFYIPLDVIEALNEDILTNDEIKKHVLSNPNEDKVMKFGEPQAKYRNGTFGLHSMEYREWHK